MQIINLEATISIPHLEADISTPSLQVEMRTLRLGSGGTDEYPDLNNKPSINSITLVGNILTANLGIKTSELTNDSGFITTADIPSKTSDLINDSDFTTGSALTAAIAAVSADIPTTTSQLTNDSGFLTSIDIPSVPTKTSDLINDSGYITSAQAPVTTVNGLTGDVVIDASNSDYDISNTIKDKIDSVEASIPTTTSQLANTSGFITAGDIPSNISAFNNDTGYITAAEAPVQSVNGSTGTVTITVPTDTNDLTNGAGYITAAEAPVQSVNGSTGVVTISVPTDTNDLTNGAGYITAAEAPVQSVNGSTGAVVLAGDDIEYSAGVTINSKIDEINNRLTSSIVRIGVNSNSSTTIQIIQPYSSYIIMGFAQGIGSVSILISVDAWALTKTINMFTGATFSSSWLSFSVNSSHQLVITNNANGDDTFTIIKSW